MNTVMENSSVVIIAKDFNISIFKPMWFLKNNIFSEEELNKDIVITPPAVQIPSKNFQFMVLPDRLQVTIPRQYPDAQSDIDRILGGIVLVAAGLLIWLNNLQVIHIYWQRDWPIILIAIGMIEIIKHVIKKA